MRSFPEFGFNVSDQVECLVHAVATNVTNPVVPARNSLVSGVTLILGWHTEILESERISLDGRSQT